MKKAFIICFLTSFVYCVFAQKGTPISNEPKELLTEPIQPCIDGLFGIALWEAKLKPEKSFLKSYYGVNIADGNPELGGVLRLKPNQTSDSLQHFCSRYSQVAEGLYTFSTGLNKLAKLAQYSGIAHLSLARKAEPQLMSARRDAAVDLVHSGVGLPMPYTGKGIITGLIDVGIEYSNPAFRTENGDSLRILKVWAQTLNSGRKPNGFNYGTEVVGEQEILAVGNDSLKENHGNIVAGALGASGYGSIGKYKSAAFNSKMIMISSERTDNSLLDGMKYFFRETSNLKKKGVFNLSWGSQIGPHDGTSLFDQAIDSIVATGVGIVVGAAGNWGRDVIHLKHTSGSSFSTSSSLVLQSDTVNFSILDLWGKPNSSFQIVIRAIDKVTGAISYTSSSFSTLNQGTFQLLVPFGKDTSLIYVVNTTKTSTNNRPNCFLAFLHNHTNTGKDIAVSISSRNNEVHGWCAQNAFFSNKTTKGFTMSGYLTGDTQYTISELGGTSKSIFTAGAHVAQTKFRNILGHDVFFSADSGQVTPFSSFGPTLDGRTKPEISSPASLICPANRFSIDPNGNEKDYLVEGTAFTLGDRTWYWFGFEVTSLASPFLASCIAVLLEANPSLTLQQVKTVLTTNTTTDQFTGVIPTAGHNQWGFGKLNLYKAISSMQNLTATSEEYTSGVNRFWYNNPVENQLIVFDKKGKEVKLELQILNLLGEVVEKNIVQYKGAEGSFHHFHIGKLKAGQYLGKIFTEDGVSTTIKLTVID